MINRELFEKAQFGDRFVTREGQEALFLRLTENSEWQFADFYVKDWGLIRVNRENGKCVNESEVENDIVGKTPSLPSNLDEAAMEIVVKMHPCMKDCQILGERITRGELIALVKAGVEWLAGQGETLNSLIWRDEDDKLFIEAFVDENKFKMAENVTIQVRKKE